MRVTVNDGTDSSAPVTSASVTVVNSAPVFSTDITNQTNTVGDTASLDADATDADTDPLTYSATDLPAGVTIAPATGVISGTITAAGTHDVTITVSDGTLSATDTFTWTVAPPATRRRSSTPSRSRRPRRRPTQTLTANVTSHDANGDTLTTSYQWLRAGLDIAGATNATLDLATAGNGDRGDLIPCA